MDTQEEHINEEQAFRVAYLIAGFIRENLTIDEQAELDNWVLVREENMYLFERLTDELNIAELQQLLTKTEEETRLGNIKSSIEFNIAREFSHRKSITGKDACMLIGGFLHYYFNRPSLTE